jgi:hypothetical protein
MFRHIYRDHRFINVMCTDPQENQAQAQEGQDGHLEVL